MWGQQQVWSVKTFIILVVAQVCLNNNGTTTSIKTSSGITSPVLGQVSFNPLEPKGSISGPLEINVHKS